MSGRRGAAPAVVACLVACLAATDVGAFEPLCNSFGAGGGHFQDQCGACSEDSAARWEPAAVTFVFDRTTVPSAQGVSAARFAQDIDISLAAWNAVPSSTLVMSDGGALSERVHNANVAEHAVYWDIDDQDWVNDTSTAPDGGALGITSFTYDCDNDGDGRRQPYQDADVVLNGTPGLAANVSSYNGTCGGRPCPSSTTVLMHELGHAVGLGHPCPLCADALMSASLIVNVGEPLPDDALSLLSLYGAPGALGTPCAGDGDCGSGHCGSFALPSGAASYCTQPCGTCPTGFACLAGQCAFASTPDTALPAVGEPCGFTCADDCFAGQPAGSVIGPGCNACLVVGGAATCVKGCSKSTGDGCDLANEFCSGVGTPDDQGQCKPRRAEGGACADDSFCEQGLHCVGNVCRAGCDPADSATCAAGQSCVDDGSGSFTCRGGLEGEACAAAADCASGFTCTGFTAQALFCFKDCVDDTSCAADEACAQTNAGDICVRARDVGESCPEFNVVCAAGSTCDPAHTLCTRPCSLDDGSGCQAGETCVDVDGDGLCVAAGDAGLGEACATSSDCQAELLCDGSACRARCDLGVPCPFGDACTALDTGSACIPAGEGEGEGEGDAGEGEGEGEGDPPGDPPGGCTCATTAAPDALALALVALLARRRRHVKAQQGHRRAGLHAERGERRASACDDARAG